ncbi:MAG: hypothetical protein ACFFD6_11845 [Candidatus Thorarchaeota archaeon]
MALTGDKVGIPEAEEAPVVVMPRFKQPIAGLISLIYIFIISIIVWWIPMLIGTTYVGNVAFFSLLGGFGLMAVLFAIWFENWPSYKLKTPWKVGILGTIINVVTAFILVYIATFYALTFHGSDAMSLYVGTAIFGALSGSCFSVGVLWVAGTMYWPFFDKKQPTRGIIVFIIGWIFTLGFWFLFFFPTGSGAVLDLLAYGTALGWTQWTIFFSLLTLMTFEYWPWNKLGSQPKIGIAAFIVCLILGYVFVIAGGYIAGFIYVPIALALGWTGDLATGIGFMNVALADWLIFGIIVVSLFMDNWPKGYSQEKNFLIRLIVVIVIAEIFFWGYYFVSPFLGGTGNPFNDSPTAFLLVLLWIQLLFAYIWRKWPIYTEMK